KPSLISIPPSVFKLMILPLRVINRRIYALMDFGIAVTQIDVTAPAHGARGLTAYFKEAVKSEQWRHFFPNSLRGKNAAPLKTENRKLKTIYSSLPWRIPVFP